MPSSEMNDDLSQGGGVDGSGRPKLLEDQVREAIATGGEDENLNNKKRQMFAINKSYSIEVNHNFELLLRINPYENMTTVGCFRMVIKAKRGTLSTTQCLNKKLMRRIKSSGSKMPENKARVNT